MRAETVAPADLALQLQAAEQILAAFIRCDRGPAYQLLVRLYARGRSGVHPSTAWLKPAVAPHKGGASLTPVRARSAAERTSCPAGRGCAAAVWPWRSW